MIQNYLTELHTKAHGTSQKKSAIKSATVSTSQSSDITKSSSLSPYPDQDSNKTSKQASAENLANDNPSTNNWLKIGASKEIAGMYFPQDYSQTPTKVGRYTLDPNQSRIQSAIDLGKSPFANSSDIIADNFGFDTPGSSISTSINPLEDQEDKSEDKKEDHVDIGEELRKDLEKIERDDLKDKIDRVNPKKLKNVHRDDPKELNQLEAKDLKQNNNEKNQKELDINKQGNKPALEQKEEQKAPPPPKQEEEKEKEKLANRN
jgi:hypothetical protein